MASGRKARRRVGRRPWEGGGGAVYGSEGFVEGGGGGRETYVPLVASEACCRNEDEPARERMSIGIARRWAAKMVFMNGMYCVGLAVETLTTRMRDVSVGDALSELVAAGVEAVVGERSVVCLFM